MYDDADQTFFTVTEITRLIKGALENNPDFTSVWVKGEISNLTVHSSGHIYFTLKDEGAVISATFFRYANKSLKFKLEEGMSVLVFGSITLFEKRGSYQLNVTMVRLEGIGELQKKIEQLKKKLLAEGIFDPRHKKPIPFLPKTIGVVTSPTGAAIRDIIKVAVRRFPNIEIVIAPVKVQGSDAPESIVKGIEALNRPELGIDVIIAGRGGGSFEDLIAFNEEIVVRAFFGSRVPIISAVGHQIDHPLSDDAADLAAPTPSAAAEIAVPMRKELTDEVDYLSIRMKNALDSYMRELSIKLQHIENRRIFKEPFELINSREVILSDIESRITDSMKDTVTEYRKKLYLIPDITMLVRNIIKNKSYRYDVAVSSIEKLSPLGVLKRGYAIAFDDKKRIIRSVDDTSPGAGLLVRLTDGSLQCVVQSLIKGEAHGKEKNS